MFLGRFGVVYLSGFKTEILRLNRKKSYVSEQIRRFKRNPMFQEKFNVSRVAKKDKSSK